MKLEQLKTVYFLGIGGIGMSAIARYLNGLGVAVHGYDKTRTELTRALESEGMTIRYKEAVDQLPNGIDLVILTPAIPHNHSELQFFISNNYPILKRAEVLGLISRSRRALAVAGTHGKTTTTSILTHLLKSGGIDCTAFLGGIATNYGSNFVAGKSDWVVVEADEYDRSFLHLHPEVAAILSMDPDHLDIYGDHETMIETGFRAFAKNCRQVYIQHSLSDHFPKQNYRTFGLDRGQVRAENVRAIEGFFAFDLVTPKGRIADLKMPLPGRHNVENATAACALAIAAGLEPEDLRQGLLTFAGIKRRFEFLHRGDSIYIDDYAHHPTELAAAIGAAKEFYPNRRITGIFQPHLYSRTQDFQDGFAAALDLLDEVILLDIYPAREEPIPGVTSALIFEKMTNPNRLMSTMDTLMSDLKNKEIDVILTLGAGDIDLFRQPIKKLLQERELR